MAYKDPIVRTKEVKEDGTIVISLQERANDFFDTINKLRAKCECGYLFFIYPSRSEFTTQRTCPKCKKEVVIKIDYRMVSTFKTAE